MDPLSADAMNFGVQLVKKFVVNDAIGQCTKDLLLVVLCYLISYRFRDISKL